MAAAFASLMIVLSNVGVMVSPATRVLAVAEPRMIMPNTAIARRRRKGWRKRRWDWFISDSALDVQPSCRRFGYRHDYEKNLGLEARPVITAAVANAIRFLFRMDRPKMATLSPCQFP